MVNVRNISTCVYIIRTKEKLAMDQTEYAESVINKYAHYLGNRKVKKTPLPSNVNERISQEEICRMKRNSFVLNFPFSQESGSVTVSHCVFTRPNLSFAVDTLSRLSAKKTMASCLFAIHVLLHLKGTTDQGPFSGSLFDLHSTMLTLGRRPCYKTLHDWLRYLHVRGIYSLDV